MENLKIEFRIGRSIDRKFFVDIKYPHTEWVKLPGTYDTEGDAHRAAAIIGEKLKQDLEQELKKKEGKE